MQDLQLIGVHEDGEHLLLGGADGERFRMRVDESLRAAIRRDRPRLGQLQIEMDGGLRPRDVQAMIRAGASAEDAADRAGWTVDKVHRYEGPILAEREHVAGLARKARLRARTNASGGATSPTLAARVAERLKGRGVEPADASWDSWRAEDGPWTVVLTFAAGGRQRQASWSFDLADKTVSAVDDEARWLSEEEQVAKGPIPAPHLSSAPSRSVKAQDTRLHTTKVHDTKVYDTKVYDVEAEGGLRPAVDQDADQVTTHNPKRDDDRHEEPLDLMTAIRERSAARGRRTPAGRRGSPKAPTHIPGAGDRAPDQALPLADLAYDPETMPPPPSAHWDPDASGVDGRPEPEAAAYLLEFETTSGSGLRPAPARGHEPAQALEPEPSSSTPGGSPPDARADSRTGSKADARADDEADSTATAKGKVAGAAGTPRAPRKGARKGGRPTVPAWDDIMFGSKPDAGRSSS